jgi:hypothetical protein
MEGSNDSWEYSSDSDNLNESRDQIWNLMGFKGNRKIAPDLIASYD